MSGAEIEITLMTTVIDCRGVDEPVTTIQLPGESDADFVKRHNQAVVDAKAACEKAPDDPNPA